MQSRDRQNCITNIISDCHRRLGISDSYAEQHQLQIQDECQDLVPIGEDVFQRPQQLMPTAAQAWFRMRDSASDDGVVLQVVSAFRSIDYQTGIIERKLKAGQTIDDILKVSAAPGFSEHHSGRALDLATPGFDPLEEVFENCPAFKWLSASAGRFGFRMSYPRNNCHSVAYEPWHWCWCL